MVFGPTYQNILIFSAHNPHIYRDVYSQTWQDYSDNLSERPQQKEIALMWLRSERCRDKNFRKDRSRMFSAAVLPNLAGVVRKNRSRKPEGPQQKTFCCGFSGFLLRSFRPFPHTNLFCCGPSENFYLCVPRFLTT